MTIKKMKVRRAARAYIYSFKKECACGVVMWYGAIITDALPCASFTTEAQTRKGEATRQAIAVCAALGLKVVKRI